MLGGFGVNGGICVIAGLVSTSAVGPRQCVVSLESLTGAALRIRCAGARDYDVAAFASREDVRGRLVLLAAFCAQAVRTRGGGGRRPVCVQDGRRRGRGFSAHLRSRFHPGEMAWKTERM